ncbi:MAG: cytochrome c maturation protein CcmE [alpha proteobacterium MED-G10]|nr:MAG: cytochrome c maturation protein CcmE [alpha proteobacterium MED-G10]
MKAKTKRLLSLTSLMVIFAAGCAVIFYNLRGNLVFFYSPTELIEKENSISQKIRLGGMVKKNSVEKKMITENDIKIQKVTFKITDFKNEVIVSYKGILPDLFKEGQGVVVEGKLNDQKGFVALNVLAKHDENYMPPELKGLDLENGAN